MKKEAPGLKARMADMGIRYMENADGIEDNELKTKLKNILSIQEEDDNLLENIKKRLEMLNAL